MTVLEAGIGNDGAAGTLVTTDLIGSATAPSGLATGTDTGTETAEIPPGTLDLTTFGFLILGTAATGAGF